MKVKITKGEPRHPVSFYDVYTESSDCFSLVCQELACLGSRDLILFLWDRISCRSRICIFCEARDVTLVRRRIVAQSKTALT